MLGMRQIHTPREEIIYLFLTLTPSPRQVPDSATNSRAVPIYATTVRKTHQQSESIMEAYFLSFPRATRSIVQLMEQIYSDYEPLAIFTVGS